MPFEDHLRRRPGSFAARRRAWSRRAALLLAAVIFGCGLEVRNYTYQAEGQTAGEGPALYVAPTRTHDGVIVESLTHDAPYRVSLSLDAPANQGKPFVVRSVVFEHEGKSHVAHAPTAEPLASSPSEGAGRDKKRMILWVPLDGLTFVDASTLTITAEAQIVGQTEWVTVTRTFRATKEEKSYTACQRVAMH